MYQPSMGQRARRHYDINYSLDKLFMVLQINSNSVESAVWYCLLYRLYWRSMHLVSKYFEGRSK